MTSPTRTFTPSIMDIEMGRPTTLNQDKIDAVCTWLHAGYFVEDAARMAKIPKSTFYNWLDKGKADREAEVDSIYVEFLDAIEVARAQAEGIFLGSIRNAATRGVWQAAAWWMERSFQKWSESSFAVEQMAFPGCRLVPFGTSRGPNALPTRR